MAGSRCLEFGDFVVVRQGEKSADVGIDQALADDFRDLALWAQDFRDTQAAEDALLVGIVGAHNHARQAQIQQVQRRQHRRFKILTDRNHRRVEVLNVLGEQGFFVRRVQRHSQAHFLLQELRAVRVGIKSEDFRAATGEGQGDLGAVTACAKHRETGTCHAAKDERNSYTPFKRRDRVPAVPFPTPAQTERGPRSCCTAAQGPCESRRARANRR